MLSCDVVVRGGQVVTHDLGIFAADVLITGSRISGITDPNSDVQADRVVDATGRFVLPGAIDPHTHWGNYADFEGDARVESRAAALGGTTTALLFQRISASGEPPRTGRFAAFDFPTTVEKAAAASVIDFSFSPIIHDPASAELVDDLVTRYQCSSFKYYLAYKDLPGAPVDDSWNKVTDGSLLANFHRLAQHPGALACVHAENAEIINHAQDEVKRTENDGLQAWDSASPGVAEAEAILRASYFAEQAEIPLYVVHLSGQDALVALARARRHWPHIYGETCTHYLIHDSGSSPTSVKYSPPVRSKSNQDALWTALGNGTLQCVASDSVCTPKDLKYGDVWKMARGAPGAGLLMPALLTEGVAKGRLSMQRAVAVSSANAARIFGLSPCKGAIRVGADADLIVVDMEREQRVGDALADVAEYYEAHQDHRFVGWPDTTLVGGRVIAEKGHIVAQESGKYVPRIPTGDAHDGVRSDGFL